MKVLGKRIYTAFAFSGFLWSLGLRLFAVVALVYMAAHFKENPVLISILAICCIALIILIGNDQIIVYTDQVVVSSSSFLDLLSLGKSRSYPISGLKAAYGKPPASTEETLVAMALLPLLPEDEVHSARNHSFYLEYTSGTVSVITTDLSVEECQRIIKVLNEVLKQ